ncbi:hypothetical protein EI546_03410 [Aequorivita sp. H23M31]|uniref:Uncharacterized protein n=1 Tax=Aequorivita ciconiae TaxID=2494375 RepID=A0A410G0N7_9FLAO|nr:hypothetical protein [Aequorivita sp. H23M31]QAA80834.1 hypothetical protein EI546_03410 [Aequorivita sp. H23M31]
MDKTKQQAFTFLVCLLFIFSCSSNRTVTKEINNKHTHQEIKKVCECTSDVVLRNIGRYRPPVSLMLDKAEFNRVSNWTLDNLYENIYFTNLGSGLSMKLLATEPIIISTKDKALTLNLTPCDYSDKFYVIPYFGINIERDEISYSTEDFDYSAFAYFDYLTGGTYMFGPRDLQIMLKEIIEEQFFYRDDAEISNDYKQFINKINTNYNIAIQEYNALYLEDGTSTIATITQNLEEAQIDIAKLIVEEFVLTENTNHRINEEEKNRLRAITKNRENLLFEKIDFKLKNQLYNGHLSGNTGKFIASVEISTDILRKADSVTNKSETDSTGNNVSADILVYSDAFYFSNFRSDKMVIDSLCSSTAEISGTGILLEFDKAQLVFPPKIMDYNYGQIHSSIKNNPLLKRIAENERVHVYKNGQMEETYLTNFTGLLVPNANLQIPIKGHNLRVKGKDLIINNQLIAGAFEIKSQPDNKKGDKLALVTDKSTIKISVNDLTDHFKRLGITQVEITIQEDLIIVFFIKE